MKKMEGTVLSSLKQIMWLQEAIRRWIVSSYGRHLKKNLLCMSCEAGGRKAMGRDGGDDGWIQIEITFLW